MDFPKHYHRVPAQSRRSNKRTCLGRLKRNYIKFQINYKVEIKLFRSFTSVIWTRPWKPIPNFNLNSSGLISVIWEATQNAVKKACENLAMSCLCTLRNPNYPKTNSVTSYLCTLSYPNNPKNNSTTTKGKQCSSCFHAIENQCQLVMENSAYIPLPEPEIPLCSSTSFSLFLSWMFQIR